MLLMARMGSAQQKTIVVFHVAGGRRDCYGGAGVNQLGLEILVHGWQKLGAGIAQEQSCTTSSARSKNRTLRRQIDYTAFSNDGTVYDLLLDVPERHKEKKEEILYFGLHGK